ncbi:hypothetical protein [Janthinobacterium sp. TND4EL3]|uniref:hypothetical protein n=1 Tax=Janthinobacterium sp. TND4EL3 TaxID=1907311 RepID=UPI0011156EB1|nr:hypothetical protein [Janthinobacterium sp. TND4EL3]
MISCTKNDFCGIQELNEFEVDSVGGGISPGVVYAIRVGLAFGGLGVAGVVVGGLAAYAIYEMAN